MDDSGDESEPLFQGSRKNGFYNPGRKHGRFGFRTKGLQYTTSCIVDDTSDSDCDGIDINAIPSVVCTCNNSESAESPLLGRQAPESESTLGPTSSDNVHISCLCDSQHSSLSFLQGRTSSLPDLYEESNNHESHEDPAEETQKVESKASSESSGSFSLWSTTRREKLILLSMASLELSSFMCLSIMAPFFPNEAAKNGISDTISGWIFGVFALTQFVFCPIFGKIMPLVGSRFMFLGGQFFAGGCVILFGLLDFVDSSGNNQVVYLIIAFSLRIFLAIGCTASTTASFAITANTFPDSVATVFGLLETATGLGMMLGPALGGVLFELGGFVFPFAALGGFMIMNVPFNVWVLPRQEDENMQTTQTTSIMAFLRVPAIWIVCLAVIVAATIWSILDPTLEPHLSVFNLSPTMVGLVFLLMSAFYAVFSPIWGWVADHIPDSSPMLVCGFITSGIGLLLVGPTPLFGLDPDYNELWLNIVALSLLGISASLAVVPTFEKILDAAEKAGIEDNMAMYGLVAGIWGGCYALGDFIGPTVGGWGLDVFGFPWCMTYVAGCCFVMAVILFALWLWEMKFGPSGAKPVELVHPPSERTPLLSSGRTTPRATLVRSLSTHGRQSEHINFAAYRPPMGFRAQLQVPRSQYGRLRIHRSSSGDFETTSVHSYNSTVTV